MSFVPIVSKKAGPVETATYSRVFHFSWKDPFAAKVLISDHFWIIISWRHYHSLVLVNLRVGKFELSKIWPMSENVSEISTLMEIILQYDILSGEIKLL